MSILKKTSILIIALIGSFGLASIFSNNIFRLVYGESASGLFTVYDSVARYLAISILLYIVLITLFYSIFRSPSKYWWIGILLIPAAAFELYFDWQHIYIPIALGIVGWLIGTGISKLVFSKNRQ